jgi:hypothetical protein
MSGRIRIKGRGGEKPQMWFTSTPKKNWLYEYFGPWEKPGVDPQSDFKKRALVITLRTIDNEIHTYEGYADERGAGLSEAEKAVLLYAEWQDTADIEKFLPSIILWDACREDLAPIGRHKPIFLSADAGITSDNFALTGVCNHVDPARRGMPMVAYSRVWIPEPGKPINFDEVEREIRQLCRALNVVLLVYDKYQLHQMMSRLKDESIVETQEFSQQDARATADKALMDAIVQRRLAHDGSHKLLREHLDNADRKISYTDGGEEKSIRLVKREASLKIDLAVSLSMALAAWSKQKPTGAVRQQNYLYGNNDN